ncbi:hypothetical protein [Calycomorphotria hydatis]|uniref:hypothetical protein n=1 Tax=Calycomorphotria hydatis TaxID=2528027 RepID=UPI0011A29456|nr:hypothetical protein [Calycomorphotria hydatis]
MVPVEAPLPPSAEAQQTARDFPDRWIQSSPRVWTYPGTLISHLTGSQHRFSADQLAGLTVTEMRWLHDNHHEYGMPPVGHDHPRFRPISDAEAASMPRVPPPRYATSRASSSRSRGFGRSRGR